MQNDLRVHFPTDQQGSGTAKRRLVASSVVTLGTAVLVAIHLVGCGPSLVGCGIPIDTSSARPWPVFPNVTQADASRPCEVNAVVADGAGGFFIGGCFTNVGDMRRNNIAHVLPDGKVDPHWNPNTDSYVGGLAISGSYLYVVGSFTKIGGQKRNRIACLDSYGKATSWNPDANDAVAAIVVSGSLAYVGGYFTRIGGQARNYVACLDASGSATSWNPNAVGYGRGLGEGYVYDIEVSPPNIFVGGEFNLIGGQPRNRIACLDSSGAATSWNPDASDIVKDLSISGPLVYAAGHFSKIGGRERNHIACIDSTGNATDWNPNADQTVHALAVSGSSVYAGGNFRTIDGKKRYRMACLSATGGATDWRPQISIRGVASIALWKSTIYIGGFR